MQTLEGVLRLHRHLLLRPTTNRGRRRRCRRRDRRRDHHHHLSHPASIAGHRGAVYALSFAPNGRLLASGGFDRSVRCWSAETGEQAPPTLTLSYCNDVPAADVPATFAVSVSRCALTPA